MIQSITVTAKIKIEPNEAQKNLLLETMHQYRDACNFVSKYLSKNGYMSAIKLHKVMYSDIRDLYKLPSQMAASVLRTTCAKYKQVKTVEKKNPKKSKKKEKPVLVQFKKPYMELVWNRDYSLKQDSFSLNTLEGRVTVPFKNKAMEQYFDGTWKFGSVKILTKHGKWYLHIPMTKDIEVPENADIQNIVGVDLGINFLAVSYDSKGKSTFWRGGFAKQKRAAYKHVRQSLQKRGTASARRRLKKIGQRENRWINDVNHCISKALVEKTPVGTLFVLEDLTGIRNATERVRRKDRYLSVSWAFYDLRQKIQYKAMLHGDMVIAVDPSYTSQTCPHCGQVDKLNRDKKMHLFTCKNCGYKSNDDRIGAMNLYNKGIKYLTVPAE